MFPVPGRTAATVELDDNRPGGSARFQVFTTTNANPLAWQLRLGIHGSTGEVTIPGRITGGENASVAGDMLVRGILKAAVKMFSIDHPLDPANRVLNHASVESDERVVQYQGNVILGEDRFRIADLVGGAQAVNVADLSACVVVAGELSAVGDALGAPATVRPAVVKVATAISIIVKRPTRMIGTPSSRVAWDHGGDEFVVAQRFPRGGR